MRTRFATVAVAAGLAVTLTFGAAGAATAGGPQAPVELNPAEQLFAQFPPPPADCYLKWDPIEDAIEDVVEGPPEVPVPDWANEWFDAFDDWCEGEND